MKPVKPTDAPARQVSRRRFFGALAAAATAAVVIVVADPPTPAKPRRTWTGKTRWIGHC